VIDGREALANIVKISAMDALRLSGQKQQIKLKLKPADSNTPSTEPPPLPLPTPVAAPGIKYIYKCILLDALTNFTLALNKFIEYLLFCSISKFALRL